MRVCQSVIKWLEIKSATSSFSLSECTIDSPPAASACRTYKYRLTPKRSFWAPDFLPSFPVSSYWSVGSDRAFVSLQVASKAARQQLDRARLARFLYINLFLSTPAHSSCSNSTPCRPTGEAAAGRTTTSRPSSWSSPMGCRGASWARLLPGGQKNPSYEAYSFRQEKF